jgi:hypothetical protein
MKIRRAIEITLGTLAVGYVLVWGAQKLNIINITNKMLFLKRRKKIQGIVIHHTNTSKAGSTVRVLEERGFSTNFEVDRDGKVYEYADPSLWEAQATGGGANAETIGIDVTHVGITQEFTPQQMVALNKLVHELADRFGFPVKIAPDNDRRKWNEWKGSGYTVFRHRNFVNTACPANIPMEKLA